MKILEITWNWSPACMESNGVRIDCYSDTCESAKITDVNVIEIVEYSPVIEGDKFFYDIFYLDKTIKRIFNPNTIIYTK